MEYGAVPEEKDAEKWAQPVAWAQKMGHGKIASLLIQRSEIDPFRKLVVYPSLLRSVCAAWAELSAQPETTADYRDRPPGSG